uniref:Uncharacterized protein n=1 Tax=Arundo donax TaxID=35708 RepID=A0A0A9C1M0_ARUDO
MDPRSTAAGCEDDEGAYGREDRSPEEVGEAQVRRGAEGGGEA